VYEQGKRLAVTNIPSGVYRLIVMVQNVQKSFGTDFYQPQQFTLNARFFSFRDDQTSEIRPFKGPNTFSKKNEPISLPQRFVAPEMFQCTGQALPKDLTGGSFVH
jgi:hypothetical protein